MQEKSHGGQGDFTAEVEDIFAKYRFPHISSETVMGLWQMQPMGFWQNQVNFAVWCPSMGCGVSWHDHLEIDQPFARSVFQFHMYYQVCRILDELQAALPQNPYDHRAYKQLCREFGVDRHSDWRVSGSNGGLGWVYNYWTNDGYHPVGNGEYDLSRMSFTRQTSNRYLHVDFIKQDAPNADTAWGAFDLDKSQGFTSAGVERLNDSIRTYMWAILGAQVQTHSGILGSGTSLDAQKQFMANVEDAISFPVDIQSAIEHYQRVLQNASSKVDYTFGIGLYMAPSDMRLHMGMIGGYNSLIIIAPVGQPLGPITVSMLAGVTPSSRKRVHIHSVNMVSSWRMQFMVSHMWLIW